jgi:hypothetical protein
MTSKTTCGREFRFKNRETFTREITGNVRYDVIDPMFTAGLRVQGVRTNKVFGVSNRRGRQKNKCEAGSRIWIRNKESK